MNICNYGCGKEAIYQLKNGKWCCSRLHTGCAEVRRLLSEYRKGKPTGTRGKPGWSKGLKLSDERRKKISDALIGRSWKMPTAEGEINRRLNISKKMIGNPKVGGYRYGSGRGKKGRYKGYWCDSSWELAWVIYNIDHNIQFERNWEKFPYQYDNRNYTYSPDFKLPDGSFVEIKGWLTEQVKVKMSAFPHTLITIGYEEIKPFIKYVVDKYGIDYIKLYEE